MDSEFLLTYLKREDLTNNEGLAEVAEICGMETVKKLIENHPSLNLRIPTLGRQKQLLRRVVEDNKDKMTIRQLSEKTGLSRRTVKKMIEQGY